MKCICANDLNRYVTIKKLVIADPTVIDDSDDGNWILVGKEWCQMLTQGSIEYLAGEQIQERILYSVTMRFSQPASQYTSKMRIEYQGRIFNIKGPPMNVDEKDKWLRFEAIEVPQP